MLDFRLNEEQKMLTETISRYARERVRKVYRDAEEEGEVPEALLRAGWESVCFPQPCPKTAAGLASTRPLQAL